MFTLLEADIIKVVNVYEKKSFETISMQRITHTKIFERFRKSIFSTQSEQNKLRNAGHCYNCSSRKRIVLIVSQIIITV